MKKTKYWAQISIRYYGIFCIFRMCLSKQQAENKNKWKREKNNNYIGCECSLEVIRIRNRIYPIAEWIQLISPHSFCAVYTVGTVQWVLPYHWFFSVYLSCVHFSSPLIHWCSKNRNIIKTFLGFQSN